MSYDNPGELGFQPWGFRQAQENDVKDPQPIAIRLGNKPQVLQSLVQQGQGK